MKSVSSETRKPYSGLTRSLVIAIDVGTTFSGVSYAILEPGEIPKIHGVTRFPGQEHVAGNTKIPTIIYYDRHGKMVVAGAEADNASVRSQAEDEEWIKTDLFKLRLRPRTMQLSMNGMRLGPLPRKKTAVHVFGDFLAYMYRCTRNFIIDTHGNGAALWNAVENDIQFVLSHPNGWEGAQQTKMRQAAVYGGLIPDTDEGRSRIRFVTEGEASLHACVLSGLATDVLQNPSRHGFLIADAGGGTLDISAYAIRASMPLVMEEIAPPDCVFAGSVFVSRRAREFLEEKLKNSKYGTSDTLDHITMRFDETTKRLFRDRKELQFIPFGSPLDKDPAVGIRQGQLKLTGEEVANLFEPSVEAAVNAIKAQIEASNGLIRSVFLVGGYAASPWLFGQLQERLAPFKVTVSRPDMQTSKAVADGAIGFYCDHHVSARMSKFMYGVEFLRQLNPKDPEHLARKERLCELPSGPKLLPDAFDCILNRSVRVKESTVFTRKYCTELTSLSMLSVFEVEIWCYRGGNVVPQWIDRQADEFSTLCVVRADLSPLSGSAEPKASKNGKTYWTIVFSIEIHFGLTEFKARIKWVDNGKTRYGPASIIYNERGVRAEEEEYDTYPEDDINSAAPSPRRDHLRSEPVSRARTPVAEHFQPTGSLDRGFDSFDPAPTAQPAFDEPAPEPPQVELQPPREPTPPVEPPREPTPPPVVQPQEILPPITPASTKKGKKGKGSTATPKISPVIDKPVESVFTDKSPKGSSALWGGGNGAETGATDFLSPITPSGTKAPTAFNSAAQTPKETEKGLDNTWSFNTSPSFGAKRSPLATTEPIIAAEAITEPPALSKEIVEPTPASEPPAVETPAAEPEPAVTPVTPTASTGKKKKKKGAVISLTPDPVPQPPPEPEPIVVAPETTKALEAEEKEEEAPPLSKSPNPSASAKLGAGDSLFDDWGVGTKPEESGAALADSEKKDDWGLPAVPSASGKEKKDDLWGSDSWGLGDKKEGKEENTADAGGWGFGSTLSRAASKASTWGAAKIGATASAKSPSSWGAKTPEPTKPDEPVKPAASPWGSKAEATKPAASSPWGAKADATPSKPTAKPATSGWGTTPTLGGAATGGSWGASTWGAKSPAANSSPWGAKDETKVAEEAQNESEAHAVEEAQKDEEAAKAAEETAATKPTEKATPNTANAETTDAAEAIEPTKPASLAPKADDLPADQEKKDAEPPQTDEVKQEETKEEPEPITLAEPATPAADPEPEEKATAGAKKKKKKKK